MARETEKDYNHDYFALGELHLLNDLGRPDYVTHNAERAYYYYTAINQYPYVVKIEKYANLQEDILSRRGLKRGSKGWREAMEDVCYDCDCWICPCGIEGRECAEDGEV